MTGVLTRSGGNVNFTRSEAISEPTSHPGKTSSWLVECCFECGQRRGDAQRRRNMVGNRVRRFQSVASDVGHHPLFGVDLARCHELLQYANGHAAGSLGKDALGA